ncbi:MAG: RNA polymerase sigma factor [bacterium]
MMDENDFQKAWEEYHDMLYRLAVTMTKNMDTAMDVVQEVMLRLLRHKGSFESDKHLKAWLIRVCINRCRDFLRSSWFLKETELDPRLYVCMEKEDRKVLDEIMLLDPKYRSVIYLHYYPQDLYQLPYKKDRRKHFI